MASVVESILAAYKALKSARLAFRAAPTPENRQTVLLAQVRFEDANRKLARYALFGASPTR